MNDHKPLIINGMPDHLHLLFGMRPMQSLSDLMQDIKGSSSKWINQNGFVYGQFSWQHGFGAFAYARSNLPNVINYIKNQEKKHRRFSFLNEYLRLLDEHGIEYNEKYLFKPVGY